MNRKDGFLFDKEAILQYIITKKTEYAKKMKEFERQKQAEDNESATANAFEEQKKLEKFVKGEKNIVTASVASKSESISNGSLNRNQLVSCRFYRSAKHQPISHFEYGKWKRKRVAKFLGSIADAIGKNFKADKARSDDPVSSVTETDEGQRLDRSQIHIGQRSIGEEIANSSRESLHVRRDT